MFLYDRWLRVVAEQGDRIALVDVPAGRRWTFNQLCAEVERAPRTADSVIFAQGAGSEFIFSVLAAWGTGAVVCPLEAGQAPPTFSMELPAGIVHLKTTSATTGAARFVAFTAQQLSADARNIVDSMGLRGDWPNVGVISLAHSYGFSNLVLPLLLHGIPLVLAGSALPEALRLAAGQLAGCTLAGVPALWRTWQDAGAIPSNVKLAISAGAPLPLGLEQGVYSQAGLKIHNFYGSSECGGIAYDGSPRPREDPACAGLPLRNVEVRLAPGGCVEVRGAAVGETYWPEPETKLGAGVFQTSDQGEIRDGVVYLTGRASDLINVAGRKVSPETIERVLGGCPQVAACVVFGVPATDFGRGEMIVACLRLASGGTLAAAKRFAEDRLRGWQLPREWWPVEDLSHNVRGKISRAEWRKRYLEKIERAQTQSEA